MRYIIDDNYGEALTIAQSGGVDSVVSIDIGGDRDVSFTLEQFKDFRRAVGYIWQEVEAQ